jgi:Ni,Fe-hydrogenase III component G
MDELDRSAIGDKLVNRNFGTLCVQRFSRPEGWNGDVHPLRGDATDTM